MSTGPSSQWALAGPFLPLRVVASRRHPPWDARLSSQFDGFACRQIPRHQYTRGTAATPSRTDITSSVPALTDSGVGTIEPRPRSVYAGVHGPASPLSAGAVPCAATLAVLLRRTALGAPNTRLRVAQQWSALAAPWTTGWGPGRRRGAGGKGWRCAGS